MKSYLFVNSANIKAFRPISAGTACRVSVIMLTMDRPQYIDAAVASVRAQSFTDWELIILQDGDDERVRQKIAMWSEGEARVRNLYRPAVGNIPNALNHAIRHAKGEFIAILDDDDAWTHTEKLALQVAFLDTHPDVVCVGGGAIVVDAQGCETMRYLKPLDDVTCRRRALLANPLIHSTAFYRIAVVAAMGGYDDTLKGYADWDFCLKLMAFGKLANLPEYFATYRVWGGGSSSRYGMSIAWSAFRIVSRHRRYYAYCFTAFCVSICHIAFALLPRRLRRFFYRYLTEWKKRLSAGNERAVLARD